MQLFGPTEVVPFYETHEITFAVDSLGPIENRRSYSGLSVAQATISGTYAAILDHLEPLPFKTKPQQARQTPVVHHASAHRNNVDPSCGTCLSCCMKVRRRYPRVKASSHARHAR